jgi:hypothetical protein
MDEALLEIIAKQTGLACPSSKHLGQLIQFPNGGFGSSWFDVKPLVFGGSSGGFVKLFS